MRHSDEAYNSANTVGIREHGEPHQTRKLTGERLANNLHNSNKHTLAGPRYSTHGAPISLLQPHFYSAVYRGGSTLCAYILSPESSSSAGSVPGDRATCTDVGVIVPSPSRAPAPSRPTPRLRLRRSRLPATALRSDCASGCWSDGAYHGAWTTSILRMVSTPSPASSPVLPLAVDGTGRAFDGSVPAL